MKSREDAIMVTAFKSVYAKLKETGHTSALHVLDNKCSRTVEKCIASQQVSTWIVEPDNHRTNTTKPAVKPTKYHVISSIATVDTHCLLQLWSKMLSQIQCSLNSIRVLQ